MRITLVHLIVAPEGVAAVTATDPDMRIDCASPDRQLYDKGDILLGLGDAGTAGSGRAIRLSREPRRSTR